MHLNLAEAKIFLNFFQPILPELNFIPLQFQLNL